MKNIKNIYVITGITKNNVNTSLIHASCHAKSFRRS